MEKRPGSFWEWLNIIGNFIAVGVLTLTLIYSFIFWYESYPENVKAAGELFWIAIIIVILTVFGQWINSRTNSIVRSLDALKGGNNKWLKRRKKLKKRS